MYTVSVRRVIRYEEQVTENVLNEKVGEILDFNGGVKNKETKDP